MNKKIWRIYEKKVYLLNLGILEYKYFKYDKYRKMEVFLTLLFMPYLALTYKRKETVIGYYQLSKHFRSLVAASSCEELYNLAKIQFKGKGRLYARKI